jgi:hypothetical protein
MLYINQIDCIERRLDLLMFLSGLENKTVVGGDIEQIKQCLRRIYPMDDDGIKLTSINDLRNECANIALILIKGAEMTLDVTLKLMRVKFQEYTKENADASSDDIEKESSKIIFKKQDKFKLVRSRYMYGLLEFTIKYDATLSDGTDMSALLSNLLSKLTQQFSNTEDEICLFDATSIQESDGVL